VTLSLAWSASPAQVCLGHGLLCDERGVDSRPGKSTTLNSLTDTTAKVGNASPPTLTPGRH
jgi:hypothetical protein